ncbi:class I SAM-dependent rRNA methyltransferase, partial [Streptococcus suis]
MKIKVNRIAEQKINKGIQLLDSADFSGFSFDEDRLAVLYSESGSYLGQAYLSKQNKGIGWLFSRSNQDLTMDFFYHLSSPSRYLTKNILSSIVKIRK